MDLNQAVDLLRKTVKESSVEGQKHIDLTLVSASDLPTYEKALGIIHKAIYDGFMTEEEFQKRVGLII